MNNVLRQHTKSVRQMAMALRRRSATKWNFTDDDFSENDTTILSDASLSMLKRRIDTMRDVMQISTTLGLVLIILGSLALLINLMVAAIILRRQRCTFSNVFYLLLLNFALLDIFKSICMIAYGGRIIINDKKFGGISESKTDQVFVVTARIFNMVTMFNLVILTLNEFIFIKYPLRYNSIVTKKSATICVAICWTIGFIIGIGSTMIRSSKTRVFVIPNLDNFTIESMSSVNRVTGMLGFRASNESRTIDPHTLISFAISLFCLMGLVLVLISYGVFFRIINKIRIKDSLILRAANRKASDASLSSSYVPVGHRINKSTTTCRRISTDQRLSIVSLEERRLTKQLLHRYKYVIVIGLVIFVYMLYFISYSTIQVWQFSTIKDGQKRDPASSVVVRFSLQIVFCLHSIFQPLCAFRIKEFRSILFRMFRCSGRNGQSVFIMNGTTTNNRRQSALMGRTYEYSETSLGTPTQKQHFGKLSSTYDQQQQPKLLSVIEEHSSTGDEKASRTGTKRISFAKNGVVERHNIASSSDDNGFVEESSALMMDRNGAKKVNGERPTSI